MGLVQMDEAAQRRQQHAPSRPACYRCGLTEGAACHVGSVPDEIWWWQHDYEPGILTRIGSSDGSS